ncbi:MAG TPA: nitroreductase, partial [Firmicutes bacterium]|nr:nitroreductase [Bacillota bacterium]
MELYEAIRERRSIRQYKGDPVPETTLNKILHAARLAPSWKNQQCWRFIIVQEEGIKHRLAGALPERNPALKAFAQAPVVVVLCATPEDSGRIDQKEY